MERAHVISVISKNVHSRRKSMNDFEMCLAIHETVKNMFMAVFTFPYVSLFDASIMFLLCVSLCTF